MATLYVSPSGSDAHSRADIIAGAGSLSWLTPMRAWRGATTYAGGVGAEAAAAGDTVLVSAGTYSAPGRCTTGGGGTRFNVALNPINNGSAGNEIVFEAVDTATINLSSDHGPVLGSQGMDYITIRGPFRLVGADAPPPTLGDSGLIVITGGDHVTIDGVTIVGAGNAHLPGTNTAGVYFFEADNPIVRNCRISLIYNNHDQTNAAGIFGYAFGNSFLHNNEIFDCGCGISLKSPDASGGAFADAHTVYKNLIYRCNVGLHSHNIGGPLTAANPVKLYQNIIRDGVLSWGTGTSATFSTGIKYQAFSSDPAINCNHTWSVNNTIARVDYVFYLQGNMLDDCDHRIWNNLGVDCLSFIYFDAPAANLIASRYDFEHNQAFNFDDFYFEEDPQGSPNFYTLAGFKAAYAIYEQAAPAAADSDPDFMDEAGNDFRLNVGSAALTGGVDMLDLRGGGTSAVIPRGAYVSSDQSEIIGPGAAEEEDEAPTYRVSGFGFRSARGR